MNPGYQQCQVCGTQVADEMLEFESWFVHRIEAPGAIVQVLTCPACDEMPHDMILDAYKERIRLGFVPGYH